MIADKLLGSVERFANHSNSLNSLADALLNRIIPQSTSLAGHCWCENDFDCDFHEREVFCCEGPEPICEGCGSC